MDPTGDVHAPAGFLFWANGVGAYCDTPGNMPCYNLGMLPNLHALYLESETRAKILLGGLFGLVGVALLGSVFLSPSLVLALTFGVVVVFISFWKPQWTMLGMAAYLPFEPFILKWIPDDVYLYARYGSELLVYLLVGVVVFRFATGDLKLKRTPIDVPFALFLLAIVASIAINLVPAFVAVLGTRQIIRFMLLFFVTYYLSPTKMWVKYLLMIMAAVAAVQIVLGATQALTGGALDAFLLPSERKTIGTLQLTEGTVQFWDPGQRVFGTMGRYDQLGTFLALVFLFAVAFIYEKRLGKNPRLAAWALLFAGLPVLTLTYSRSAWFGFLLGFLFIAILMKKDRRVAFVATAIPVIAVIYLAVTGLVVSNLIDVPSQTITERFFEAFSYERWKGEYEGYGRLYWIVQTVAVVVPASPVFGFGPGQYGGGAVAALGNDVVYGNLGLVFGVYGTGGYIDNNWMSLWGETGTLGLFAFSWLYLTLFAACIRIARDADDKDVRAIALGTSAALIAFALNAFLASFFEIRTLAPYVWMLAGATMYLGHKERVIEV